MRRGCLVFLLLAVQCIAPTGAAAAFDAYLMLEGVPGESTDPAYPGWIGVSSYAHRLGVAPPEDLVPGHFGDLVITKQVDRASPLLALRCAENARIASGKLEFFKVAVDAVRFYAIELWGVRVRSVDQQRTKGETTLGDLVLETVALSYERIQWSYTQVTPLGETGAQYTAYWDSIADGGGYSETEGPDTDGDGLPDVSDPDDDGDGMPDAYEVANGLDRTVPDAGLDPDGDGLTSRQEYIAGTRANDPDSVLRVSFLCPGAEPGSAELTWTSVPGKLYEIEMGAQLEGPYSPYATSVAADPQAATTTALVPLPAGTPMLLFFRVRVLP